MSHSAHILGLSASSSKIFVLESIVFCKLGQILAGNRPFGPCCTATQVTCSETEVKSMELDTNAFLLNLAKFSQIWGGGGLNFYVKTSS